MLLREKKLWVSYTFPCSFSLFRYFGGTIFNFLNYFVWLRITDEGSVPEMRIWSVLLIKSDLKLCIHFSRSLFFLEFSNAFNFNSTSVMNGKLNALAVYHKRITHARPYTEFIVLSNL